MRVPSRFLFPLAAKPRLSLPRLLLAIIIVGALIGGVIAALGSGAWWVLLVLLIVTIVSNRRWRMRRAKQPNSAPARLFANSRVPSIFLLSIAG